MQSPNDLAKVLELESRQAGILIQDDLTSKPDLIPQYCAALLIVALL